MLIKRIIVTLHRYWKLINFIKFIKYFLCSWKTDYGSFGKGNYVLTKDLFYR